MWCSRRSALPGANKAQQGFDSEAKSASAELDRWRSEAEDENGARGCCGTSQFATCQAEELASAIDALDVQKQDTCFVVHQWAVLSSCTSLH